MSDGDEYTEEQLVADLKRLVAEEAILVDRVKKAIEDGTLTPADLAMLDQLFASGERFKDLVWSVQNGIEHPDVTAAREKE
jgi:hypothetical protein